MYALATTFRETLNRAGAFQAFQWNTTAKQSQASVKRDGVKVLTKTTTATVRTGVEYKNLAVNADRETGALPWGEWLEYPYVVTHKGTLYGRLYAMKDSVRSTYYVDNGEVTRAEWLAFQAPSAAKVRESEGNTLTLTIRLENMTAI